MAIAASDVIPLSQARTNLSELASEVKAGAEKMITKNGEKYVALTDADRLDYYHRLERKRSHFVQLDDIKCCRSCSGRAAATPRSKTGSHAFWLCRTSPKGSNSRGLDSCRSGGRAAVELGCLGLENHLTIGAELHALLRPCRRRRFEPAPHASSLRPQAGLGRGLWPSRSRRPRVASSRVPPGWPA